MTDKQQYKNDIKQYQMPKALRRSKSLPTVSDILPVQAMTPEERTSLEKERICKCQPGLKRWKELNRGINRYHLFV